MKKSYELKNAAFTCDVPTAAELRALGDAALEAIARNAYAAWAYRRGARAESDGKHYTLADVAADMLATGERGGSDGGMTKVDEREIAALFKSYGLTCADDIHRGYKTEAEKEAAVLKFATLHGVADVIDAELASSDNALAVFQAACSKALYKAIDKWNSRVDDSGHFTRDNAVTVLENALAFLRAKRRFLKDA